MKKSKYVAMNISRAAESKVERELKFVATCKNDGLQRVYDLNTRSYAIKFLDIVGIVAWAIYRLRDSLGHTTRIALLEKLHIFFDYLDCIQTYNPESLNKTVLTAFSDWLKTHSGLSYPTAGNLLRSFTTLFKEMSKHPRIDDNFAAPKNAFPKSSALINAAEGYDQQELKTIVNAAVQGIRESAVKLESIYKPRWLSAPPPLEDVAPTTFRGTYSIWASKEYRIWWWENNCDCKRLNSNQLFQLPKGQSFFNCMSGTGIGSMALVNAFYDEIGAGPGYQPRYLGKPSPINYVTPWKKKDYLVWYWENKLGCAPMSGPEARKLDPDFYGAIRDHFGSSTHAFFSSLGVERWIQASDLIPYYLMLLIRTQLNPSTIQRLKIDCLVADPFDETKKSIDWTKFRSYKKGKTIPSSRNNDNWPIMLIERIIKITEFIRKDNQDSLWIANSNPHCVTEVLGRTAFQRGLRNFSKKYNLIGRDGLPLLIKANLIRPTMAWHEYLRTEDLTYLQTLMGHTKIDVTADYIRRRDDPVLRAKRAIHQDAMFIGLTQNGEIKTHWDIKHIEEDFDGILNHCQDPLNSPISGQKSGTLCSGSHEVCLGCQNLVITAEDIKKYFCYIAFHDYLLQAGDINDKQYQNATTEKKFIWENYILPKYDRDLVEKIRTESICSPIPVWDVSLYEKARI